VKPHKPIISGKKIEKAGKCLIDEDMYIDENKDKLSDAFDILSVYRFGFVTPLENALKKISPHVVTVESNALFSKRLKRHVSIVKKLQRFPDMNLKNMQDIGGCRVIVSSNKQVYKIARALKRLPEFKLNGKYRVKNYIENPKKDGYRSYHITGKFVDDYDKERRVEVQVRTEIQHYWATALEIVDLFTKQSLKSNQGDRDWQSFFQSTSLIFANFENISNFHNFKGLDKGNAIARVLIQNTELMTIGNNVADLEAKLKVIKRLEVFASSLHIVNEKLNELSDDYELGYVLLIINVYKRTISYHIFGSEKQAEDSYKEEEKQAAIKNRKNKDTVAVALVYANNLRELKAAYPNFFADSSKFLENLNWIIKVQSMKRKNAFQKLLGL
jgi:ppGpp synthetase/RelA/SpoT-type nucleotidyltranferase